MSSFEPASTKGLRTEDDGKRENVVSKRECCDLVAIPHPTTEEARDEGRMTSVRECVLICTIQDRRATAVPDHKRESVVIAQKTLKSHRLDDDQKFKVAKSH